MKFSLALLLLAILLNSCANSNAIREVEPADSKWAKQLPATDMNATPERIVIAKDASLNEPETFQIIEVVTIDPQNSDNPEDLLLVSTPISSTSQFLIDSDEPEEEQQVKQISDPPKIAIITYKPFDVDPYSDQIQFIIPDSFSFSGKQRRRSSAQNKAPVPPPEIAQTKAKQPATNISIEKPEAINARTNTKASEAVDQTTASQSTNQQDQQSLSFFVIQLLAAKTVEEIQAFVKKNNLPSEELWVARTKSRGEPWLALFYGGYSTTADAYKEAELVKQNYQLGNVWVRPLPKGVKVGLASDR